MTYLLFMDDNVIYPSKSCPAIPDGPVHMPLEGVPAVPEAEGNPLVFEGGGDGGLLHILWVDRDLMITFPKVNVRKKKLCNRLPWRRNPAC